MDDEALVLQGLQRMLRPLRAKWEMEFLDSGAKALERMAHCPFDIVVSDMLMPGMNGAELLSQAKNRYPKTVRLILSGHADKDLILKCVGSAHQYLAKPCDPDTLRSTVQRASDSEHALRNENVARMAAEMDRLPSVPSLYTEIIEALRDPEVSLQAIGAIIARDIGMTAKILKLLDKNNLARLGLDHRVETWRQAWLKTNTTQQAA